jgi:large subunit ribosomal protein L19
MKASKYTKETIREIGIEKKNFPTISIGDTVVVSQRIKETLEKTEKERIQLFEGDIIAIHNNGISSTFTVRRIGANAVPVEKIFPYHSPLVADIKFVRKGKVRRAKLYYMRKRIGKASRVEEVIQKSVKKQQDKTK